MSRERLVNFSRLNSAFSIGELELLAQSKLLFRLIDSFFPVDCQETISLRAFAVANIAPQNSIAELFTAAWVWLGGAEPVIFEFCGDESHRIRSRKFEKIRTRDYRMAKNNYQRIGSLQLTTPLATAISLAKHGHPENIDQILPKISELINRYNLKSAAILAMLSEHSTRNNRLASQRIRRCSH